ncbi:transcriptional regulator, ArsR family [Anaerobranca californiensis DSM 14826]|jgi:DNA-binding transcriptional ArsR family regulator|uniref:Transcriptional regulator, ArsR family n=1 Tax=Anaerobranca californiensis DSM 14826 TaxID=1120989 RepID=A0A1M6LKR6_9FIRM|nr:metalloregulator ArsR/SmtB family transcription factor [Anaerobranca californiensis]SHJ71801.1 transcriptional regulator, ArsR family [Anaerobranca californiensis DSM 14826]
MNINKADITRKKLTSKLFKGFADYTRLSIFEILMDGEKTVSEIVERLEVSQSVISNHLKCLRECELVRDRQEGKFVYYSISDERVKEIIKLGQEIIKEVSEEKYNCLQ